MDAIKWKGKAGPYIEHSGRFAISLYQHGRGQQAPVYILHDRMRFNSDGNPRMTAFYTMERAKEAAVKIAELDALETV
jgi:hypothetical protein